MDRSLSSTSGASKKRKQRKKENENKKCMKIETFFKTKSVESVELISSIPSTSGTGPCFDSFATLSEVNLTKSVGPSDEPECTINVVASVSDCEVSDEKVDPRDDTECTRSECVAGPVKSDVDATNRTFDISSLIHNKHPTDRGLYPVNLADAHIKRFVVQNGPCRPPGPFPQDNKGRSFSESYYYAISKAGLSLPVTWLCYSPNLDAAYCEVCWLFGDRSDPGYRASWSTGISDWQGLSKKIKKHKDSKCHVQSGMVYDQWRRHAVLDEGLEKQVAQEKIFWREVLGRLVKITLNLACNSQSFRGHRENIGDVYNGNFLSQVELLAEYDPVMSELINKPKGSIKYLSPTIQNELISLLAKQLEANIISEIQSSSFYSIIADTTQDISKKDQLSLVLRYAVVERDTNGEPTDVKVEESFLGFYWTRDQSAAGLSSQIVSIIEEKGLQLDKCRGQGYDGASVMSGAYGGVQRRILDMQPCAKYIHCAAHNLNLVVNDAVSGVKEVVAFFTLLQDVYVFFGQSICRWDLLSSFTRESSVTIKKLNPTRWAGRILTLLGVKHNFIEIMKALTNIILRSKKKEEREEASRLRKSLDKFEFVLLLVVFSKILGAIDFASKYLQMKDLDLSLATQHLETALEITSSYRHNYIEAKTEAILVSCKWGVEVKFQSKRQKVYKRQYGELSEDHRITESEDRFRINVFLRVLDIVNEQLKIRFKGMREVVEKFSVVDPTLLCKATESEIINGATALQNAYPNDLSTCFPLQLVSFRSSMQTEICKTKSVKQLAKLLIVDYKAISSSYLDVCTALLLFITLPVTVAQAERSFSKLKYIKNYLRNTMGQERLQGLAILSIEASRAKSMDRESLIDRFAEIKSRRKSLGVK